MKLWDLEIYLKYANLVTEMQHKRVLNQLLKGARVEVFRLKTTRRTQGERKVFKGGERNERNSS